MTWNWELPEWPAFYYDSERLAQQEKKFLLAIGSTSAFLQKIETHERSQFLVEIMSAEGEKSSRIEGEMLDRESLQSSIKKHFGLQVAVKPKHLKEKGMAELLCQAYESYDQPLTHEMLWQWHAKLFPGMVEVGKYRDHEEPMQIVGNRLDRHQVYFEAPPSRRVPSEMQRYIDWFNRTNIESVLAKTAIAHLYFENIHPFEDGNGRIGRVLVEKCLSQGVGRPIVLAVSKVLEKRKKEYYQALESCNRTLDATRWVEFFAEAMLQAQEESTNLLQFILAKSKCMAQLAGKINARQEKALLRMFEEGPNGFQGGLSAEKYVAITGASRATATRDLNELVELGALSKMGELRHTRYSLNI